MSNFNGKGSNHRPHDKKKFDDNFDKIFRKPKESHESKKPTDSQTRDKG